jgi:hypothetical protein
MSAVTEVRNQTQPQNESPSDARSRRIFCQIDQMNLRERCHRMLQTATLGIAKPLTTHQLCQKWAETFQACPDQASQTDRITSQQFEKYREELAEKSC